MQKGLKTILLIVGVIILLILAFFLYRRSQNVKQIQTAPEVSSIKIDMNENIEYKTAILKTSKGEIIIELASDKPLATQNFIKLANQKFYDGVKFHRVIKDFMIQTGDPLSKDESQKDFWGTGGPEYKFNDELTGIEKYEIGTVAMANSGPNTNGSQFFIMTSNTPLPPLYTIFGKVVAGQEVAQKIQEVSTDSKDRPLEAITIDSIELK